MTSLQPPALPTQTLLTTLWTCPSKATVDADLQPAGVQGTQHACLLRCWALSFLSLPPYRGCELLVNQQLSCKDRRLDRQKQTTRSQRNRHTWFHWDGRVCYFTRSESDINHIPQMDAPRVVWRDGTEGQPKGLYQSGCERRPHQRKMNRQHRGKRQREREKYTQDFLQLPTPLHPGTVFKKRQESLTDSEGDLCPGPTGLTSHPSVPLRLHFQRATPLQVDQQRPGWGCRAWESSWRLRAPLPSLARSPGTLGSWQRTARDDGVGWGRGGGGQGGGSEAGQRRRRTGTNLTLSM